MPCTLNRPAYKKLLQEDVDWLNQQPRSLERDHIIDFLQYEIEHMAVYTFSILEEDRRRRLIEWGIDPNTVSHFPRESG